MQSCWQILNINPTNEINEIKKAYAEKSKLYHPEEKPQEFLKLRKAYEQALKQAEDIQSDIEDEIFCDEQIENNTNIKPEIDDWQLTNKTFETTPEITNAIESFLEIYTTQKRKDTKIWYKYFTSDVFLDVWRDKAFTSKLLEQIRNTTPNKEFLNPLNAVYGVVLPNGDISAYYQFTSEIEFDGLSDIKEIFNISKMPKVPVGNELAMQISFCEYRHLNKLANENIWNDITKDEAEYIFGRYVNTYIKERCEERKYNETERYISSIKLITRFIKNTNLPDDLYHFIWKTFQLDSAQFGRSKILYGEIKEILQDRMKDIQKPENYLDVTKLHEQYQRMVSKNIVDKQFIFDFFANEKVQRALQQRHFIKNHITYWIALPNNMIFLEQLEEFYKKHLDCFNAENIIKQIKNRKQEIIVNAEFNEDENNIDFSKPDVSNRPFLRYWLNIAFNRFYSINNILENYLPFSEKWAKSYIEHYNNITIYFGNREINIKLHRRYAEFFIDGIEHYDQFLLWEDIKNLQDATEFFLLLPVVIPFIETNEDYNECLQQITSRLPHLDIEIAQTLADKYYQEDFIEEELYIDTIEIYAENDIDLYSCSWSSPDQTLLFYKHTLKDKILMPLGVYENIPDEKTAISIAKELLSNQIEKKVADIYLLNRLPNIIYAQPKLSPPEEISNVNYEDAENYLNLFAEDKLSRLEFSWQSETLVLLKSNNNYACIHFNDKDIVHSVLLSIPKFYVTVDTKDIVYVPFSYSKLANFEVFQQPNILVNRLCKILYQFGHGCSPDSFINGEYFWSYNVHLHDKSQGYFMDKLKLGEFKPERIMNNETVINRRFTIPILPNNMVSVGTNDIKNDIPISRANQEQLQTALYNLLNNNLKYIKLSWQNKTHLFLLQEDGKYALFYLIDDEKRADCLVYDFWAYLDAEGKDPMETICNIRTIYYNIHYDLMRFRYYLDLLLVNIENPSIVIDRFAEFSDATITNKKRKSYNDIYNELINI